MDACEKGCADGDCVSPTFMRCRRKLQRKAMQRLKFDEAMRMSFPPTRFTEEELAEHVKAQEEVRTKRERGEE